ncbi:efflux RND transporter periplasmic adaptor subunit [Cryobacterium sinapicolor]|uniref:Efflux RND transporter periplasmic adaptor subunit n=1 Tax=Cryobacterium sinapicolor TaxID=1259236 RepID=A0ABY2J9Z9_9MICO|nr:efflux RND transporter periplasmic adaptor subunit [Cryobacterium sinapicolor]TFD00502.1 efflux RND transporter periplasmic adaptor subunit [Cryobacterium sinapicolor]
MIFDKPNLDVCAVKSKQPTRPDRMMARKRRRNGVYRPFRVSVYVAALLVWVLLPVGGFTYLSLQETKASIAPVRRVWSPIDVNDLPLRADAQLAIVRSDAYEIVAPNWSGLVQEVRLEAGAVLRSGQVVVVIDGISRLAIASGRPFSRTLVEEDIGDDVARLNAVLRDRGLDAGNSDVFTRRTLSGVRALADSIGAANPDDVSGFDPTWFIFLQSDVPISEISLRVGSPAPAAGEVIATGKPLITSARLQERPDAGFETAITPEDSDGAASQSGDDKTAGAGEVLYVGSQPLELTEDRGFVAPSDLAALESLTEPDSTVVRASLETQPKAGTWLIPSAAIFAEESGNLCTLVKMRGGKTSGEEVTVLGTTKGLTVVSGTLVEGQQVLISPAKEDRRCD